LAVAQCRQRHVQRGGAGVHGYGVSGAGVRRELLFEALHLGTGGHPTGTQAIGNFGNLFLADERQAIGQKRIAH